MRDAPPTGPSTLGFGCGIVVLLIVAVLVLSGLKGCSKFNAISTQLKEHPEHVAVLIALRKQPDITVQDFDPGTGKVTFTHAKTPLPHTHTALELSAGPVKLSDAVTLDLGLR
jgi:hypothetical protein